MNSNSSISTSLLSTRISWAFSHTLSGLDQTNSSASSAWGKTVRSSSGRAKNRHMSIKSSYKPEYLAFSGQDSLKNDKSQRLKITQTWLKLAPVCFPFKPGWDPSWVSGRVSLRSSSYTLNFHKNAARSAYQSELLIKELLYSCWRHIRGKCAVDLFSPFWWSFGKQMREAITAWTWHAHLRDTWWRTSVNTRTSAH